VQESMAPWTTRLGMTLTLPGNFAPRHPSGNGRRAP
jgi:hypothetical protein